MFVFEIKIDYAALLVRQKKKENLKSKRNSLEVTVLGFYLKIIRGKTLKNLNSVSKSAK